MPEKVFQLFCESAIATYFLLVSEKIDFNKKSFALRYIKTFSIPKLEVELLEKNDNNKHCFKK